MGQTETSTMVGVEGAGGGQHSNHGHPERGSLCWACGERRRQPSLAPFPLAPGQLRMHWGNCGRLPRLESGPFLFSKLPIKRQ